MAEDTRESGPPPEAGRSGGKSRMSLMAWCLFDWANSSYPTIVVTFVFATFFTRSVATSPEAGTAAWGTAISISALLIAVLAPIFGAISDLSGRRKPWLALFSGVCIASSFGLWWVEPDPAFALLALSLVILGNGAFELGQVFYNAMLPDLAPRSHIGRLSGWSWSLGYAGGLASLSLALLFFVQSKDPLFGLDQSTQDHIRIVGPFVGLWFLVFAWPLFVFTPEGNRPRKPIGEAVRKGLSTLAATLKRLPGQRQILLFLIARMIYTDGLNTLFAFGGIYAAGTFGMSFEEILIFAILLNVTAGLGAAAFAWIDDWIGPKSTLVIALLFLLGLSTAILLVESKEAFTALGCGIGIFIGPAQAASRSFMARVAPPQVRAELFGLYALSGKVTSFVGPALVGWVTIASGSQRIGMATILIFFVAGLVLLVPIRDPDRDAPA